LHARSCCPPLLDSPTIIKGILLPLCTHSPFSFTDHFVRTLLSSFTSRRPHHHKGNSSSFTHTHSPFSSSDHLARTPLLSSTSRRPHRHSGSWACGAADSQSSAWASAACHANTCMQCNCHELFVITQVRFLVWYVFWGLSMLLGRTTPQVCSCLWCVICNLYTCDIILFHSAHTYASTCAVCTYMHVCVHVCAHVPLSCSHAECMLLYD